MLLLRTDAQDGARFEAMPEGEIIRERKKKKPPVEEKSQSNEVPQIDEKAASPINNRGNQDPSETRDKQPGRKKTEKMNSENIAV